MRRGQLATIVAFALVFLFWYNVAPGSIVHSSWSFLRQNHCPSPLTPAKHVDMGQKICESLETDASLADDVQVELCLSTIAVNQGYFRISRKACAETEHIKASNDPDTDRILRSKGPDFFQVVLDGEQRLALEVDVEYLGSCTYKYPFALASAGPFNATILWQFKNYRAAIETEELALQYDVARPVFASRSLVVYPYAPTTGECGPNVALPTRRIWRTYSEEALLNELPLCPSDATTPGHYLRPHHSEFPRQTFQRFIWQPAGCRYADPILFGAPAADTQRDFKRRNVLFIGDSHARYAYDLLLAAYEADWDVFLQAPPMKKLEKTVTINGPLRMDFVWEATLLELRIQLNCSTVARYDTIVLGAGQHNAIRIPQEVKDHYKQWSLHDWSELTRSLAHKLSHATCPGQPAPHVIWMGNPARFARHTPAATSEWVDGRSSWRIRLYDETAWAHFKSIGGSRVDMFSLSQPFVNDFKDMLHMRHTDSMAAMIQDLHHKLRPTEEAYAHPVRLEQPRVH